MAKKASSAAPAERQKREHLLAEHVERLANELQLTRQVLDELRTEIQWAVQNCFGRTDPADSPCAPVIKEAASHRLLPTFDEGDAVVLWRNGEEIFGEVVTVNDAENFAEVLLIPSNLVISVMQDELSRIHPDILRRLCSERISRVTPPMASDSGSATSPSIASDGRLF